MKLIQKKRFGQHFIKDKAIVEKIVTLSNLKKDDLIWEIGGGKGILTQALIDFGLKPTVFEIDYGLQDYLERRFGKKIELVKSDILKIDWFKFLKSKTKIVANLPYNISSPFLFKVAKFSKYFESVTVMIQKEVADRIVSTGGSKVYGRLSLKMQYYFKIKKLFDVNPSAFDPPPKVNSSVIYLQERRDKPKIDDLDLFFRIIDLSFGNRRKMLRVNLKSILDKKTLSMFKFPLTRRGETLSEKEFIDLYQEVKKYIKRPLQN